MGKLKKRPEGYAPPLQFLLRRDREGGEVLAPGKFPDETVAQGRRSCLVMVHGFNNNDGEAAVAYDGFRKRLIEGFGANGDALNARLGDAFWPGDAKWGWFDIIDFGVYPGALGRAHETADELLALLRRMPALIEVDFIGHSLGCRVILETLHHLKRDGGGPAVRRVCLMAAAVPMEKLEPGGDFHDTLTDLAAKGTRVLVLHSRQDKVLHYAFSLGQALAGPGERSTRALGREGPNPLLPGYHGTLEEKPMGGADHGDYWGHSTKPVAGESARTAGRFFGLDGGYREIGVARSPWTPSTGFPSRAAFSTD